MLSLAKSLLKLAFSGAIVLVLGSTISWNEKTAADRIKEKVTGSGKPAGIIEKTKTMATEIYTKYRPGTEKIKETVKAKIQKVTAKAQNKTRDESEDSAADDNKLSAGEKRALRSLIKQSAD
ncbi:MAG: hypothetical protein A2583_00580 [Bdellovibrionales bacterium RIFOXYD1_FULL_53_11]|nr:MAG: hypothetical protein A2583_00580 [Bdellovibrionales bacterium RIFOXYD1_FULL_53_11]